ncbi:MAG: hypothetical protein ACI9O6_000905 [Glaciecola sp.]|jgi:hypothetical protein
MIFISNKSQRLNLKIDAELQESLTLLSNRMKVSLDETINAGLETLRGLDWESIIQNYRLKKLTIKEVEQARYFSLTQIEKELMIEKQYLDDELIQSLCNNKKFLSKTLGA